jgi:hypothetical protein
VKKIKNWFWYITLVLKKLGFFFSKTTFLINHQFFAGCDFFSPPKKKNPGINLFSLFLKILKNWGTAGYLKD